MKNIFQIKSFIFFILFLFINSTLSAEQGNGYLITKDEKFISGEVVSIHYSSSNSKVVFRNIFGNLYHISPFLIKGFVFQEENKTVQYESKFVANNWVFLKVEVVSGGIRLYHSVSKKTVAEIKHNGVVSREIKANEYWLEVNDSPPFRIYELGFRKKMKNIVSNYPILAEKIGKKGYRFKNLKEIIIEYNTWWESTRIMM